ncbi:MAG: hypothetical protein AAFP81_15475 [Pseudomonadota bacterium]
MKSWSVGLALTFALSACHVTSQPSETPEPRFDALSWIGEGVDPVTHLVQEPATCLRRPEEAAVKRGELLFESPFLLGGQAAKSGISCAACHRNGRGNPDFELTGISGTSGTADVTNGFFSKHRADNVFNPVPIPDLARPDGRTRVNRIEAGTLEAFLASQVSEEFDGTPPDPVVVADLAAYVRALDDRHCTPGKTKPQTWQDEVRLLRSGVAYINSNDLGSSNAYVDALRAALGRLHARFQSPKAEAVRDHLIKMSRTLERYPDDRLSEPVLLDLEDLLREHEAHSFYQRSTLSSVLD